MDLEAAAEQIFPMVEGLGYGQVDDGALEAFGRTREDDPGIGPYLLGVVGRWIGTADSPVGVAMALLVDPGSGAAQHAADQLAAGAEELEIEGQPCYRFGDIAGSRFLVTCAPPVVLYLSGRDDFALAGVAGTLFRAWKAAGRID
jgi:hypothetical protein